MKPERFCWWTFLGKAFPLIAAGVFREAVSYVSIWLWGLAIPAILKEALGCAAVLSTAIILYLIEKRKDPDNKGITGSKTW